jgi:hypothetical protein
LGFGCWLSTVPRRLERVVREACAGGDRERVQKIIDQLCHEYAYAVHQPHARNGGLIGLAAASIALGPVFDTMTAFRDAVADSLNRTLRDIYQKSFLLSWLAFQTRTLGLDTMPVRACTILQKSLKERFYSSSTTYLMLFAK